MAKKTKGKKDGSKARKRTRAIAKDKVTKKVTQTMQDNAVTHYRNNKEMNKCKKLHETARKELYAEMTEADVVTFTFPTTLDGAAVILQAEVKAGNAKTVIDITKLLKKASQEQLCKILSASVSTVKEVMGAEVAAQCSVSVPGKENVTVKPKG